MRNKTKTSKITSFAVAGLLTLGGCAASTIESSDETVEIVETTIAEDLTESSTTTAAVKESSSPDSTTNLNVAGGNDPEDFLMPNVICMNLQEAQDEIQDRGVFYSRSVDLSGQDRNQIIDSNWIVLQQTPSPGTKISEGDAVLGVVKIGESTRGIC